MKSFNGDHRLKDDLLAEVVRHREADKIVQGTYGGGKGKGWRGCAVGCAIHSLNAIRGSEWDTSDHGVYERELGIPRIIARLEDRIFEGLSAEESKSFPERFISSIPVGADLSKAWPKFIVWLLGDAEFGVIKFARSKESVAAIKGVLDLYVRKMAGGKISTSEWAAVRENAADAAADAYAAYAYADAAAGAAAAYAAYAAYADAAYAYAKQRHYARMASALIDIISKEI